MAKVVDYPRASLENSLQLAEAVASLGGSCSIAMAADKMGRKVSGAFNALVSAAVKYGLIASKEGKLSVQSLYRSVKLAYSDAEKRGFLGEALLSPPLFRAIVDRFEGQVLPTEHFEKLLVREFSVPDDQASRIAQYFVQGAKQVGLVSGAGVISRTGIEADEPAGEKSDPNESDRSVGGSQSRQSVDQQSRDMSSDEYSISFKGPGLNSTIVVREQEDLLIVDAMLKKVSKALRGREGGE